MKKSSTLVFVLCLTGISLFAGTNDSAAVKSLMKQANGLLVKAITNNTMSNTQEVIDYNLESEENNSNFKQALTSLQKALEQNPTNANLNYKAGLCYYFSYDQQLKALPYFQKALKQISPNYDFTSTSEKASPNTALYFLASTYLQAGKPDSALKYFSLYKEKNLSHPINADREISMCYNAKENDKHIRNVQVKALGDGINSEFAERNPVVKIDNSMLFFSSNRPASAGAVASEDIYISKKGDKGQWLTPEPFAFNTVYDEAPLFITLDGKTLYLRRTINGNSDIYFSRLANGTWTKPEAFAEINSPSSENGFSMTADGKTVYFSSDRNKPEGKFDIYQCQQDKNGKWGAIQRLPRVINTAFNETSPFINPDGKTLFFSSDGYESKGNGGYDIYYSELKKDKTWSIPQSMGFPINTTRNDINYYISAGDKRFYSRLNGDKSYDLYSIEGGGFDFESISASTDLVTVTNEMNVSQVVETEKEVQKDVEVTKTVETEVVKEKEVEIHNAEPEKEKETEITKPVDGNSVSDVNMENLTAEQRAALVEKVKNYLSAQLAEKQSVSFKTVYFDINKSNLNLLSMNELILLVEFLNEHPTTKVEVVGNTDNTGVWQKNLKLSNDRAKEVYDFLLKNKVSPERMYFYGRASAVPLLDNSTEDNRSKNRRVEVLILKSN
jgi:outer membrane protein OmpA-like peptidoglycan-associated protein/tetratricopeptide (TPR) repeat protein